ncbi:MAG: sulfatase-like hydrolase/transferase [Verrucomicrobiae bacterium]|nr:sulfatase-like hydrolase/transferase [Verrucomicrobiae bacterium]
MNALIFLGACTFLRLLLWFQFKPEAGSVAQVAQGLLIGLHLDLVTALVVSLPWLVWLSVAPRRWVSARWHRWALTALAALGWSITTFLFFVEYFFFEEFKSRFNTVAVDYLLYPKEVGTNIWESYPVVLIVVLSLAGGFLLARTVWRWTGNLAVALAANPFARRQRAVWAVVAGLLLVLGLPLRLSEARFSPDRLLNEIANNGQLSFIHAAMTRHMDFSAFYRTLPPEEAWRRSLQLVGANPETGGTLAGSFQRLVPGDPARPRLNVVLLLEESLGSEFWGVLGAGYNGMTNSFTPCLDALAEREGLLFTNLYATGNRTIRGLEGVLASFPPLPGDSIVARDRSDHIETIASVLRRDGYETFFIYGGRSLFDGMGKFALQNGYQRFIEQKDFAHPTFTTSWGVCDEDLFDRLLQECRQLHQAGRPFLATSLSVSNHKPYTYPPGRIPEDPDKHWRHHAVKYADYALGRFFEQARREPFYTNTIFVVVADHGARVYGRQTIPLHSYRIPLLIVGPAVVPHPARNGVLGGSMDVAPTVLGLIHRPYLSVFFGQDLCRIPPEQGRALVQHNRDIGMIRGQHMVVLGLNKTIEYYHRDTPAGEFHKVEQPTSADRELLGDAISLFQIADTLYLQQRYWVHTDPASTSSGLSAGLPPPARH